MTWDGMIAAMGSFEPETPAGGWQSPSSIYSSDYNLYAAYAAVLLYPSGSVGISSEVGGSVIINQLWGQYVTPKFYEGTGFYPIQPGGDPESDPLPLTDYEWKCEYVSGDAVYYELTSGVPLNTYKDIGQWTYEGVIVGAWIWVPTVFGFARVAGSGVGTSSGTYKFTIRKKSDLSVLVVSTDITVNLETLP